MLLLRRNSALRGGGALVTTAWSPTVKSNGTQTQPVRGVRLIRGGALGGFLELGAKSSGVNLSWLEYALIIFRHRYVETEDCTQLKSESNISIYFKGSICRFLAVLQWIDSFKSLRNYSNYSVSTLKINTKIGTSFLQFRRSNISNLKVY